MDTNENNLRANLTFSVDGGCSSSDNFRGEKAS